MILKTKAQATVAYSRLKNSLGRLQDSLVVLPTSPASLDREHVTVSIYYAVVYSLKFPEYFPVFYSNGSLHTGCFSPWVLGPVIRVHF